MNSVTPPTNEQPEEQVEGLSTKNTRGPTQMHKVHAQKECKLITLNGNSQPVGPTDEVVTELSSFLGTLARTATLCPFDILHWRNMDTKKDLWDYTKEKYIIPEAAQEWALTTIRDAWRRHRRYLKLNYYDPYDNDEVRMAKKPSHIPYCQFRELLKYWKSEKFKKMSETNTKNRKKLMNPHTAGKKSFALVRSKLVCSFIYYEVFICIKAIFNIHLFVTRKKIKKLYHKRMSLLPQEQGNPGVRTRPRMKTQLVKLLKWRKLKKK